MSSSVPFAPHAPAGAVRTGFLPRLAVALATAIAILGATIALVAEPLYLDGALDRAGSARNLGVTAAEARAISESVVLELVAGPGSFTQTMTGPDGARVRVFVASEASHLRDVRTLLLLVVAAVLASGAVLVVGAGRVRGAWFWRAVARGAAGLALTLLAVGVFFAVAFDAAFTLFHLVAFPGGNWSFDPSTERMVQLYPTAFWQEVTVVLAVLAIGLAAATWLLARRRAARLEDRGR